MEKVCPKCNLLKGRAEYYADTQPKDGLSVYCKPCIRSSRNEKYKLNPRPSTKKPPHSPVMRYDGYLSIPLSKDGLKHAIVDGESIPVISGYRWLLHSNGYAYRYSTAPSGKQKMVWMHREIMSTPKGMDTDHINGDKLDNRKINLRICTHTQNLLNKGRCRRNSSGYKGVFMTAGKWEARICKDGKRTYLGLFTNKEEAHAAYCKAAAEQHGEFARFN